MHRVFLFLSILCFLFSLLSLLIFPSVLTIAVGTIPLGTFIIWAGYISMPSIFYFSISELTSPSSSFNYVFKFIWKLILIMSLLYGFVGYMLCGNWSFNFGVNEPVIFIPNASYAFWTLNYGLLIVYILFFCSFYFFKKYISIKDLTFIWIILVLILPIALNAQDMKEHMWSNRLLLLYSNNEQDSVLNQQMLLLRNSEEGLKDRKILVYRFHRDHYMKGLLSKRKYDYSTEFDRQLFDGDYFQIKLIGLDGTVKQTSLEILMPQDIFEIIDAMPLRQMELRNNKRR